MSESLNLKAVDPEPAKAIQRRMLDKNFAVASFKYREWAADLTEDQTLEDAFGPQFWSGQAAKIMGHDKTNPSGRGDLIHVRKPDTGLYVKLIVTEVGSGFIKVAPVEAYQPKDVMIAENSPLTTRWQPGKRSHEVIRRSDGQVMATGFQTKASAAQWIADHIKAMAA